jgi:hypothetical protein
MDFAWFKYRAIDLDNDTALWPEQHPLEELLKLREWDPVMFSREYQNDPTDDASALFPLDVSARMLAPEATFESSRRAVHRGEIVVLGYDPAASGRIGADYCSLTVIAVDIHNFERRFVYGFRAKGLDFDQQVELLRSVCREYGVTMGYVEQNGFQRWLPAELEKYHETRCIVGHNTGLEKANAIDGIPGLSIAVSHGRWDGSLPCGDRESAAYAKILRTEAAAYGWRDGKLQGLGEHDDTVLSWWLADRAARYVERFLFENAEPEIVYIEDLFPDWEPVDLGDY